MSVLVRLWAWLVSWFKPSSPRVKTYAEELVELARYVASEERRIREQEAVACKRITPEQAHRMVAELQQEYPIPPGIYVSNSFTAANAALWAQISRRQRRTQE